MFSIEKCPLPANTLLGKYSINGTYIDCYSIEVPEQITLSQFIFAFYTTRLFKLERFILKLMASKPSTDAEARQLADGDVERFAGWFVEGRTENEILMCDFSERTRSWLMTVPVNDTRTRLYFGSVVVPIQNSKGEELSLGFGFQVLLRFHKVYSVLLLFFARLRITGQLSDR